MTSLRDIDPGIAELLGLLTTGALACIPQWVAYRIDPNSDSTNPPVKFPFDPNRPYSARLGFDPKAKANDPATWAVRAKAASKANELQHPDRPRGVGIILGELRDGSGRHIGGLDLDGCRNPATERIEPWAIEIMARLDSYSEVSPSGTGLKVIFTYDGPHLAWLRDNGHVKKAGRSFSRGNHVEVSIWISNKFFTVTENWFKDSPPTIENVSLDNMLWLIQDAGPRFKGSAANQSRPSRSGIDSTKADGIDRSGVLFDIARDCVREGKSRADFEVAARDNPHAAGHLADSSDPARTLQRAWDNATELESRREAEMRRAFDDDCNSDPIAEFNQRFAFVRISGKFRILDETGQAGRPTLLEEGTFHKQELARTMLVGKRPVQVSHEWMRHPTRRQFLSGIGFYPDGAPTGVYNLWQGWSAEPETEVDELLASCERFLAHVREIICAGDRAAYDYAIRWMAHLVQRPGEKPGVAIILRGLEGTGKDTLGEYLGRLCKAHYRTLTRPEDLTGRFNGLLDDALILHFQEIAWAGDPDARNRLYSLVSSPEMTVEGKGLDAVQRPSVARLIISSNADWVVPASLDARRFAVFDVSAKRMQDRKWFRPLRREMDGLGPVALLAYLRSIDLAGFDVRRPPNTKGLVNQKLESLRDLHAFWRDCLEAGTLPPPATYECEIWANGPITIGTEKLRASYDEWRNTQNYRPRAYSPEQFGQVFGKVCPEREKARPNEDGKRPPAYKIPSLADCREKFAQIVKGP